MTDLSAFLRVARASFVRTSLYVFVLLTVCIWVLEATENDSQALSTRTHTHVPPRPRSSIFEQSLEQRGTADVSIRTPNPVSGRGGRAGTQRPDTRQADQASQPDAGPDADGDLQDEPGR